MHGLYKHAVVAAFRIYAQCGEDVAKRGGWRLCISHGNYITYHGKSCVHQDLNVFVDFTA